jgi:hypothetical protein
MPRQLCMVDTSLSPLPPCCASSCVLSSLLFVEPNKHFLEYNCIIYPSLLIWRLYCIQLCVSYW